MNLHSLLTTLRNQHDIAFHADAVERLDDDACVFPALTLRAAVGENGSVVALSAGQRSELLRAVRAGEFQGPLLVEAITYVQRPTPNRNATRFAANTLRKGARSFRGQVVLVDHNQREQRARIGTIVDSVFEDVGDDTVQFRQTLSIAKLDAIESVLDGTIDRFSIGWFPTGRIDCSLHKGPMFGPGCCQCWPGDVVEVDGVDVVVQAVFTAWEGIEVSAVNVPAVVGTGIEAVRSALSVLRANINSGKEPQEQLKMDIRTKLGLPPTATDEEVLATLDERQTQLSQLQTSAAEAQRIATENAAKAKATRISSLIEAAYGDGRLAVVRDQAGERIQSPMEVQLRALDDADRIEAFLSVLPKSARVPTVPEALDSARKPAATPAATLAQVNPHLDNLLPLFGLTEQDVRAFGPQHRAAMKANAPVPRHLATVFSTRHLHAIPSKG